MLRLLCRSPLSCTQGEPVVDTFWLFARGWFHVDDKRESINHAFLRNKKITCKFCTRYTAVCRSLTQVLEMEGVDQLGLSFECLELKFCSNVGDVHPDDDITDENKVFLVCCRRWWWWCSVSFCCFWSCCCCSFSRVFCSRVSTGFFCVPGLCCCTPRAFVCAPELLDECHFICLYPSLRVFYRRIYTL